VRKALLKNMYLLYWGICSKCFRRGL